MPHLSSHTWWKNSTKRRIIDPQTGNAGISLLGQTNLTAYPMLSSPIAQSGISGLFRRDVSLSHPLVRLFKPKRRVMASPDARMHTPKAMLILALLLSICFAQEVEIVSEVYDYDGVKMGLRDKATGRMLTPIQYEDLLYFRGELAVARLNGRLGVIDKRGRTVLDHMFYHIQLQDSRAIAAKMGNRWFFFDRKGQQIGSESYAELRPFEAPGVQGWSVRTSDGLRSLIGLDGEIIIPAAFLRIDRLDDGYFRVLKPGVAGIYHADRGEILPPIYDWLNYVPRSEYGYSERFADLFWVQQDSVHRGIMDANGQVLLPFEYTVLALDPGDILRFSKGGLWGLMFLDGEEVLPPTHERIEPFNEYGLAMVENHFPSTRIHSPRKKYGLINRQGEARTPLDLFTGIGEFELGRAIVRIDSTPEFWDNLGMIDTTGAWVIPPVHDAVGRWSTLDSLISAKLDRGIWGYYNHQGELAIPAIYTRAEPFSQRFLHLAIVQKILPDASGQYQRRFGMIDTKGREIIPIQYDEIRPDYQSSDTYPYDMLAIKGEEVVRYTREELERRIATE